MSVFNLMSRTNKTRSIKWHESCKCICRLNGIICNNKQRANCECECDKSCNIGEYLDYSDCKCQKKLINSLIEKCTENDDETKLVKITITENNNETNLVNITITKNIDETKLVNMIITKNEDSHCNSCKVYIVLMIVAIVIYTGTTIYFVYYIGF